MRNSKNKNNEIAVVAAEKTRMIVSSLTYAREKAGLSRSEVAKKCGLDRSTLFRIETGDAIPNINTLIRIATVVGAEIDLKIQTEGD